MGSCKVQKPAFFVVLPNLFRIQPMTIGACSNVFLPVRQQALRGGSLQVTPRTARCLLCQELLKRLHTHMKSPGCPFQRLRSLLAASGRCGLEIGAQKGPTSARKMGPPGVRNGGFSRAGGGAITEGGRSPTGVMAPPPAAPPSQGGPSSFSFCFSSTRGSGSFRHSSQKSGNGASNGPGVLPSSSRRERSWSTR